MPRWRPRPHHPVRVVRSPSRAGSGRSRDHRRTAGAARADQLRVAAYFL